MCFKKRCVHYIHFDEALLSMMMLCCVKLNKDYIYDATNGIQVAVRQKESASTSSQRSGSAKVTQ